MGDKKTVLIADDDRTFVGALKAHCMQLGVNVATAYDTLATVLKINAVLPDVVCLDLNMPGGSGLNVCEMLSFDAQKTRFPLIPKAVAVIALTGLTDDDTIRDCHTLGVHYVPKGDRLWDRLEPLLRQLLGMEPGVTKESPAVCLELFEFAKEARDATSDAPAQSVDARREMEPERCGVWNRREILVIEDDPGVVDVVRQFLDGTDFEVIHCDNLQDAKRLATHAAAILCDIHLPNARGTFIIREVKADGFNGPIVVITGDSSPLTVMECARTGIDGILLKPFSKRDLMQKLAAIVKTTPTAGRLQCC